MSFSRRRDHRLPARPSTLLPPLSHPALRGPKHLAQEGGQVRLSQPGDPELRQAVKDGWVVVEPVADSTLVQRLAAPHLSETDAAVVACALEKRASLVLADDPDVRVLAEQEGFSVIGSVGILTQARLEGVVRELKPLLDQLVTAGFHLDPHGRVYQDALKRVGEIL